VLTGAKIRHRPALDACALRVSSTRSMPIRPRPTPKGDPVTLPRPRTTTSRNRRKVVHGLRTPTTRGLSRIEREFEAFRSAAVTCALAHIAGRCNGCKFARLRWAKTADGILPLRGLRRPTPSTPRTEMLERGEWRAKKVSANPKAIGSHLSRFTLQSLEKLGADAATGWPRRL